MKDEIALVGFLLGVIAVMTIVSLLTLGDLSQRTEQLCTLAFSHAETRLDSLEVTVTYDFCEVEE